jgi:hypothetical protein
MNAVLNRGNLILGVSWALAIGLFLNRAGKMNAPPGGGTPQAHASQVIAPAAAASVEGAPVEVPVIAEPVGEALSRNDPVRPLP